MSNISKFPSDDKRPNHTYNYDKCAGCGKPIADDEPFTEIIMTSNDGMTKKHIALCQECDTIADDYKVFD